MHLLAAAHVTPWLTLPAAGGVVMLIAWYWLRLGAESVPESRRRLRRVSLAVMLIAAVVLVRALSFVDPVTDPRNYTITWVTATSLVLLVIFIACLDAMNNLRIHRAERREMMSRRAEALRETARRLREQRQAAAEEHPDQRQ